MEKDSTTVIKRIIVAVITILIVAYIISVGLKANFTQVKTETANIMTVSDSIPTTGYFIRDEQMITYDGDGVISYLLNDGDKISKDESVANVYTDVQAANDKKTIDKLEQQINALEQLDNAVNNIMPAPDDLDKNISSSLSKAKLSASEKNFTDADKSITAALYSINQRQLVTGKTQSYSAKISELKKKMSELKKKYAENSSRAIKSTKTGYFSSTVDGYESFYNSKALSNIKIGDLNEKKITKRPVGKNVVGKTVEGVYWYVACEVSANEAIQIKESKSLSVDIPLANNHNISVELHCINQENQNSDAVVILKGSYMNQEMINLRREDISIIKNTYNGIYVSRNAVHDQLITETQTDKNGKEKTETKTVKGVYILVGNELLFKQIVPVYTGEGFIICMQNPKDEDLVTDEIGVLKAYDEVVVEGANLYDGKIIDRTSS